MNTATDYIDYIESRLKRLDEAGLSRIAGEKPQFPMLVSFIGKNSLKAYPFIHRNLAVLWPQYTGELQYVGVVADQGSVSYCDFQQAMEGGSEVQTIPTERVAAKAEAVYDTATHFSDYTKVLLYHIIDTAAYISGADFQGSMQAIGKLKEDLYIDRNSSMEMVFVLLDEIPSKKKIFKEVRAQIAAIVEAQGTKAPTFCILSNRNSDNQISRTWVTQYGIVCAAIAASNNADAQITEGMFRERITTVSYAREEKPTRSICQFLVCRLLDYLAKYGPKPAVSIDEDALASKLSLTESGTLSILNHFVENNLLGLLPTEEQLELFPRKETTEHRFALSGITAGEFNEYTMGAWEAYLRSLADQAREAISSGSPASRHLKEQYISTLRNNMTAGELIYLSEHPEKVRQQFGKLRKPSEEYQTLKYGEEYLKYLVCGSQELQKVFQAEVLVQGVKAKEYLQEWKDLLQSTTSLHDIREGKGFELFYGSLFRDYFDTFGNAIITKFQRVSTADDLNRFICKELEDILLNDKMKATLRASFEDELKQRLAKAGEEIDVNQYISEKLSAQRIPTYLQVSFHMGYPVQYFVFLKKDTGENSLYTTFLEKADVPESTFYYDTGSKEYVEVLNVFSLSPDMLLIGD